MSNLYDLGSIYELKTDMLAAFAKGEYFYIQLNSVKDFYAYPTEDFCLYKYFPYKKAILSKLVFWNRVIPETIKNFTDKCTYKLLAQNYELSSEKFSDNSTRIYEQDELLSCELEKRVEQCFNSSSFSVSSSY